MHSKYHYVQLAVMAALSFIAMYVLMYAMVDHFDNVYGNINQIYMAALMAAPMVLFEILVMHAMYPDRTANLAIGAGSIVVAALFFVAIRNQAVVGDTQFLKSMIPHHASAILMCERATIRDEKIKALCRQIIKSQQDEIDQMKAMLAER